MEFAAALSPELLAIIERDAARGVRIADINRRVGAEAARRGLTKPSYERVRMLVHHARRLREAESAVGLVADVLLRTKPAAALYRLDEPRPLRPTR